MAAFLLLSVLFFDPLLKISSHIPSTLEIGCHRACLFLPMRL
jgi:hypothetical protein